MIPGLDMGVGLVSCLMCTMASRWTAGEPLGVRSFREQTYARRELVIVTCDPCEAMFASGFDVNVVPGPQTLGGLREESRQLAQGEYLTTWDDDDYSHPNRIKLQVGALSAVPGADCCTLLRINVDDQVRGRKFVSPLHGWEMTMLARRESLPPYDPGLQFGEDTDSLARIGRVVLLDRPDLYTLIAHAGGTASHRWAAEWWEVRDRWRGGAE